MNVFIIIMVIAVARCKSSLDGPLGREQQEMKDQQRIVYFELLNCLKREENVFFKSTVIVWGSLGIQAQKVLSPN